VELTVVTTVGGNYSQYMADWAESIARQTRRPDHVVVVDNGSDDPDLVEQAATRLGAELVFLPFPTNYGRARNIAVSKAETEWVQHFDCDDVMLPHALEETEQTIAAHPDADVISWNWFKDVNGKREVRQYRRLQGEQILRTQAKGAGPSPFRKAMWDQAPYDDLIEAAWDTTLWIGFAHLGATFQPTKRVCFEYRQHDDSVFNSRIKQVDKLPLRNRVGERLRLLAAEPIARAVVAMPWRDSGDEDRRRTMEWAKARWESYGFPVVQHPGPDGPFNRSAARNGAVAKSHARVVLIADADVMVNRDVAWQAVDDAVVHPWVVPHGRVHRLSRQSTDRLIASDGDLPEPSGTIRQPYDGVVGGGLLAITPSQFARAGRYDETFEGWGMEDEAFGIAASGLLGRPERYETPLWHMYHDPGLRQKDPAYWSNRGRFELYKAAVGDRPTLCELVGSDADPDPGFKLPARFVSRYKNYVVMMPGGRKIKFVDHKYVARDRAVAAWLLYGPADAELEAAK